MPPEITAWPSGEKATAPAVSGWRERLRTPRPEAVSQSDTAVRAVAVASRRKLPGRIKRDGLEKWLGSPRFPEDARREIKVPGVVQGLAWTPYGGDVLFIEVAVTEGKGGLALTGLCVAFSPDGKALPLVLVGLSDRLVVRLWDVASGHQLMELKEQPAPRRAALSVAFSLTIASCQQLKRLQAGGKDGNVRICGSHSVWGYLRRPSNSEISWIGRTW